MVGALRAVGRLDPFTDLVEGPTMGPFFIPFGTPPVQDMLKKMIEAGNAAIEWIQNLTRHGRQSRWPRTACPASPAA